jgi:hypothetical protein
MSRSCWKGPDFAVTRSRHGAKHGAPGTWDEAAVNDVLVETLRATRPEAESEGAARIAPVSLLGFSWIVEPLEGKVVIAIEIPMGAAVAGPFDIAQPQLDALITRTIQFERMKNASPVVH